MIFSSGLELKKIKTSVSKWLGILQKTWGGGSSASDFVKTASSAAIIVLFVYSLMWFGGYEKCDGLYCGVACSVGGSMVD